MIRPPHWSERDAILDTIRSANLLPDDGLAEVGADLDTALDGRGAGLWLIDAAEPSGDVGLPIFGVAYYAPERMTDEGTWNLLMLAVHPARQHRGHGRALVAAVEDDLRNRHARLLVIDTSGLPECAGQRRFYTRLGYEQQAWISNYYAVGDPKVVYSKPLAVEPVETSRSGVRQSHSHRIRPATPADLPQLFRYALAFYEEDGFSTPAAQIDANLRQLLESDTAHVAVALRPADDIVAFAISTTTFGLENGWIAELEDLYVRPEDRRSGIAAALIDDAATWATNRGSSLLEVVIAPNDHDIDHLHRYYANHGFVDERRQLRSRPLI